MRKQDLQDEGGGNGGGKREKELLRARISGDVEKFLQKGGRIQRIPSGLGLDFEKYKNKNVRPYVLFNKQGSN